MFRKNRKLITLYVVLVGLPMAILLGTLKGGLRLSAPLAIGGNWTVDGGAELKSLLCLDADRSRELSLWVSQSGKYLVLDLNHSLGNGSPGAIEGNILTSAVMYPSAQACGDRELIMTAVIGRDTVPLAMSGSFVANGCAACAPAKFTAVRQREIPLKGAH